LLYWYKSANTDAAGGDSTFVKELLIKMQLPEPKSLRFAASRLKSLLQTLEVVDVDSYAPLSGALLRLY
jgi:hypothetical protein